MSENTFTETLRYIRPLTVGTTELFYSREVLNFKNAKNSYLPVLVKEETFVNKLGVPVFITFRNGAISEIPPIYEDAIKGRRTEKALYYLVKMSDMDINRHKDAPSFVKVGTYGKDITAFDKTDQERRALREVINYASDIQSEFRHKPEPFCKGFNGASLCYLYRPTSAEEMNKDIPMYWEDVDVVISLKHPDELTVVHPHSRTMRNIMATTPELISKHDQEGLGVMNFQMKFVTISNKPIYMPIAGQVYEIQPTDDNSLESGLHIYCAQEGIFDQFRMYQKDPNHRLVELHDLTHVNGFYDTREGAQLAAEVDIDALQKYKSKLLPLEFEERRYDLKEKQNFLDLERERSKLELEKERDQHAIETARLYEQHAQDMKIKEQEQKIARAKEIHEADMLYTQEKRNLEVEALREKQRLEREKGELERTITRFKFGITVVPLLTLVIGGIFKLLSDD